MVHHPVNLAYLEKLELETKGLILADVKSERQCRDHCFTGGLVSIGGTKPAH